VLHLLGFDHERGAEARKMEAKEVQILDRLGFSNPYV
jgi:probable rRNA maturation factor